MYSDEEKEEKRKLLKEYYNEGENALTEEELKARYNFTMDELKFMDEMSEVSEDILDSAVLVLENMREQWSGFPTYQFADELIKSFQLMYPKMWTRVLTGVLGCAVGRAAGLHDDFHEIVKDIDGREEEGKS